MLFGSTSMGLKIFQSSLRTNRGTRCINLAVRFFRGKGAFFVNSRGLILLSDLNPRSILRIKQTCLVLSHRNSSNVEQPRDRRCTWDRLFISTSLLFMIALKLRPKEMELTNQSSNFLQKGLSGWHIHLQMALLHNNLAKVKVQNHAPFFSGFNRQKNVKKEQRKR